MRNKSTLKYAMKGVDNVFHAAALKQVPSCESFHAEDAKKVGLQGLDGYIISEMSVLFLICK